MREHLEKTFTRGEKVGYCTANIGKKLGTIIGGVFGITILSPIYFIAGAFSGMVGGKQ